jgi:hypothetical protein
MHAVRGCRVSAMIPLALIFWGSRVVSALGDGGTLRAWKTHGDYEIAVFTDAYSIVTGPVDISVLLLDRNTGEPDREARVLVEVSPEGRPAGTMRRVATERAATNKLFRAVVFELRDTGRCNVIVRIGGPNDHEEIHFDLIVGKPWSAPTGIWPWILWPLPVIGLHGIHRRLVQRSTKRVRLRASDGERTFRLRRGSGPSRIR